MDTIRKQRHTAGFGLSCPLEIVLDPMGGKW